MAKESTESDLRPISDWIVLSQDQKDAMVWGLFDWLATGSGKERMHLFRLLYAYIHGLERPNAS